MKIKKKKLRKEVRTLSQNTKIKIIAINKRLSHLNVLMFHFFLGRPFSNKTSISEKIEKIDKERKDEREREKDRDKDFPDRDEEHSGRGRGGRGRGRGSRGGGRGRGSARRLQSK